MSPAKGGFLSKIEVEVPKVLGTHFACAGNTRLEGHNSYYQTPPSGLGANGGR